MKKMNVPTKDMGRFAGKWVAINTKKDLIIAVGDSLTDISPFVSSRKGEESKIKASAFLVPRKDEGPYVLIVV